MSRGFEIASGIAATLHGLDEEAGKLAGDSVYGPYNNLLGEFNFFAISLKVAGMLDKLGRNRMHPIDFRIEVGARALGLAVWDYAAIADGKGKLHTKGNRAQLSSEQVKAYVRQAHLLYDTANMEVEYGPDSVPQQRWRCKSNAFRQTLQVEKNDWLPALHVVTHLGTLAFAAAEYTAKRESKQSPFGVSFEHFRDRLAYEQSGGSMNYIGSASEAVVRSLISHSNDLVALEPLVAQSRRPFLYLDPEDPRNAARSALQVIAVNYLKAAAVRDPITATMMTDIAYSAWGMTRMGGMQFTDDELETELLQGQWALGLPADPYWIREDKKSNQEARDLLAWQLYDY